MYLVAPTEPSQIKSLGEVSSVPERLGADVIWATPKGLAGVQRKTVSDLIASVRDTRIGKELEQMQRLVFRGLVVEGTPQWTRDGELLGGQKWSIKNHQGVFLSAQSRGVMVLTTRNHLETIQAIEQMAEWSQREQTVSSLLYRGNGRDKWGQLSDKATAVHFLSGIPGVGTELAERIYDRFGGVPLKWSVEKEELMTVKGVGKVIVEKIWRVLESPSGDASGSQGDTDA